MSKIQHSTPHLHNLITLIAWNVPAKGVSAKTFIRKKCTPLTILIYIQTFHVETSCLACSEKSKTTGEVSKKFTKINDLLKGTISQTIVIIILYSCHWGIGLYIISKYKVCNLWDNRARYNRVKRIALFYISTPVKFWPRSRLESWRGFGRRDCQDLGEISPRSQRDLKISARWKISRCYLAEI